MHRTVDRRGVRQHTRFAVLTAIHGDALAKQNRRRHAADRSGQRWLGSQELTRTSAHFKHVVRDALDGHAEPSDALDADNTALVRKLRHCGAGLLGSLARRPNCTCSTQA